MGLRDWVSEKGRRPGHGGLSAGGPFNGAPRLGLGEGVRMAPAAPLNAIPSMGLRDWVSEKVRAGTRPAVWASTLQWGSETGSRRRAALRSATLSRRCSFNGAPRLGLGEGVARAVEDHRLRAPSMGLRDWVSEKATARTRPPSAPSSLQWGSETGSRRRRPRWEVHGEAFLEEVCERFKF